MRIALLIPFFALAAGCATFGQSRTADSVSELERQLEGTSAKELTVSTETLRELTRNRRDLKAQCSDLSQQLEAIKKVDLQ